MLFLILKVTSVHEDYNWTDGCIALTNQQIDQLTPYVVPGMIVVIH